MASALARDTQRGVCHTLLLLLLFLVSSWPGADPHIKSLPAHHNSLACLQREDHFERSPVDPANIRSQTHELDKLSNRVRSDMRSADREPGRQSARAGILVIQAVDVVNPDNVVRGFEGKI